MDYVTLSTYDKETTFSESISIPTSVFPTFTVHSPVSTYNIPPHGNQTYDSLSDTYARSCNCQTIFSRGPVNVFIDPISLKKKNLTFK